MLLLIGFEEFVCLRSSFLLSAQIKYRVGTLAMKHSLYEFRSRPRKVIPPFPCCQCVEFAASDIVKNEYGHRFSSVIFALDPDRCTALIGTNEEYRAFGQAIVERLLEDRSWLSNLIASAEERMNHARDYARQYLTKEALQDLSNQELSDRFTAFHELYRDLHVCNTPPWWIGSEILTEELLARLTGECSQEKDVSFLLNRLLVAPEFLSEQAIEEESLLRIAVGIAQDAITREVGFDSQNASITDFSDSIQARFHDHVTEFSSIPFGYSTGVVWDEDVFWKRIQTWLQDPSFKEHPEAFLQTFLRDREDVKMSRIGHERSLNLSEDTSYLLHCLRQLGYLQDVKKTTQVRSHPVLVLEAYAEIARRLDISQEWMFSIDYREVVTFLAQGGMTDEQRFRIRSRLDPYAVFIMRDMQTEWITGDEAKDWMYEQGLIVGQEGVKEIHGSVASKGFARGRVCLAKFSNEIDKMRDGDILVTAMTTPDFVAGMKKAAAIVTDEGGVTCHAAIVSRELHKPCVIGTKIATSVLKDGNTVEVDAERGIVRILSSTAPDSS